MKVKEESEKVGLKLNIQKIKIMASGPISSVQSLSRVQFFKETWLYCEAGRRLTMLSRRVTYSKVFQLYNVVN